MADNPYPTRFSAEAGDAQAPFVGPNPITGAPGENQWLGHQAAHHNDEPTIAPGGNRIPPRSLPLLRTPRIGAPTPASPLGDGWSASLGGGDGDDAE